MQKRIERSLVGKRFFMIELAHQSLNSRFGIGAHIFFTFISEFNRRYSLSGSDEPVDSEMSVVTLSTSMIYRFSLPDVLIGIRLRTCIHRGKYACVCEHLRLYFIS